MRRDTLVFTVAGTPDDPQLRGLQAEIHAIEGASGGAGR
jgi:hypothetical protein